MLSSPFSIAITSLGEERANLSTFLTFVRFALVFFSVSSSSWCLGRAASCDCGTPWTFLLLFWESFPVNCFALLVKNHFFQWYLTKHYFLHLTMTKVCKCKAPTRLPISHSHAKPRPRKGIHERSFRFCRSGAKIFNKRCTLWRFVLFTFSWKHLYTVLENYFVTYRLLISHNKG